MISYRPSAAPCRLVFTLHSARSILSDISTYSFIIFSFQLLLGNSLFPSHKGLYSLSGEFPLYPRCPCPSAVPIRPPKEEAQEAPWSAAWSPSVTSPLWQWGATAPLCSLEVSQFAVLFVMLSLTTNWWTPFQWLVSWPHSSCGFLPLVGLGLSSEVIPWASFSLQLNWSCLHYSVPNLHEQDLEASCACFYRSNFIRNSLFLFWQGRTSRVSGANSHLECLQVVNADLIEQIVCSALPWEEASLCRYSLRKRFKVISKDINHPSSLHNFHWRRSSCIVCRFGQCTPSQLIRASANSTAHPDSWSLSCLLLLSVQSQTKSWHKAYRIKMFWYHMVAHPPFAPLLTST